MNIVNDFMTDAIVVAIALGLMVFVHELGHFLAAKWYGVRVLTFSLGFGKRLFSIKRGDTVYCVSILPLGGYVKMAGEDPTEARRGDPAEFLSQPRSHRFVIALMGPAMNVALALILLTGLYHYHFPAPAYREQPAKVGAVVPNSPAERAGIRPGDVIVRLGSLVDPRWEEVELKIQTSVGENLPVEVLRAGRRLQFSVVPKAEGPDRVGNIGVLPYIPPVVGTVEPGQPAAKAGIKPGDRIMAVDGKPVYDPAEVAHMLQALGGRAVDFTIQRGGEDLHLRVQPVYGELAGEKRWYIGVGFRNDVVVRRLAWPDALSSALDFSVKNALLTFDILGKILTRHMSARSLTGPIGIAQLSGEAYRAGWSQLVMVVAVVSLQLAIFNLLPIPILDGGVILLLAIEAVMRRDLSLRVKERVLQIGMAFLLLLAVFVIYNDLAKTFRAY